ncbi:MAG: fasciclin domain-containing protein [Scytonema sp. PMC 1069.18]|nr:fasciclin domain-containing protein [Scytonema sp. PMC 1069.18]MEC4886001.1 fasciclin domain-containing protein [Scytonema sp. PMC 1070.18]
MYTFLRWSSRSAAFLSVAMTISTLAPIAISTPVIAQTTSPSPSPTTTDSFSDIPANYWAQPFIQALAQRNIVTGFPDGTFKPQEPVERAEFATMIANAFNQNQVRPLASEGFRDVPKNYWAAPAIQEAFQTGFMEGYAGGLFLPEQPISKVQAVTALATGLRLSAKGSPSEILNNYYQDAEAVPDYATNPLAAATEANLVVNYPNVRVLNPQQTLTRAEAAALLYQALVQQGSLEPVANNTTAANYIVTPNNNVSQTTQNRETQGSATTVTPMTRSSETQGSATTATSTTRTSQTQGSATTTTSNTTTEIPGDAGTIYALSTLNFTTLSTVLKSAGLADTLSSGGPYTVFAPTDQAFAALPKETLRRLLQPENRETLARILRYHIIPGQITANELKRGELKTLADSPLNVQIDSATNQIAVNDASVIQPNIQATNGIIHAVNKVLLPPDLNLK